jgi:hypothetical protein
MMIRLPVRLRSLGVLSLPATGDHSVADNARLLAQEAEHAPADLSVRLDRAVVYETGSGVAIVVTDRIRTARGAARRTNSLVVPVRRARERGVKNEQEADHPLNPRPTILPPEN